MLSNTIRAVFSLSLRQHRRRNENWLCKYEPKAHSLANKSSNPSPRYATAGRANLSWVYHFCHQNVCARQINCTSVPRSDIVCRCWHTTAVVLRRFRAWSVWFSARFKGTASDAWSWLRSMKAFKGSTLDLRRSSTNQVLETTRTRAIVSRTNALVCLTCSNKIWVAAPTVRTDVRVPRGQPMLFVRWFQ